MKLESGITALLFPGQGSQIVGMGRELGMAYPTAKSIFQQADSILGFGLSTLMWDGPEVELNDTVNTQPALYVHSYAAFSVLKHLWPEFNPAAVAGHSLGQLSAAAAAGSLTFEAGLRLVRRRGELMKRAGESHPGGMAAILNLGIPQLEAVCAAASTPEEPVQVANDNSPGQVVISGAKAAVERAMQAAKAAGAKRTIPLTVSIAAHSKLMASIQDEWNEAVGGADFKDLQIPLVGNVACRALKSAADVRNDIEAQMQSRVRWTETVQLFAGQGLTTFAEVGTGNVLLGLARRIANTSIGFQLGTPADFAAIE